MTVTVALVNWWCMKFEYYRLSRICHGHLPRWRLILAEFILTIETNFVSLTAWCVRKLL